MGKRQRRLGMVGLALAISLVAAACGGGGGSQTPQNEDAAEPQRGGVWRTAVSNLGFDNGFDPTGEYVGSTWGMFTTMLRPLMGYRFTAGEAGNEVVPDLAAGPPEVSADGLTYTFKLKPNIQFGPPVSRAITSRDVKYAFQRMNTEALVAQYGSYYKVIEGFTQTAESPEEDISGITTPDDSTIVFKLTEVTGDFPYRVAMPATAPIPVEVAKCFTDEAAEYGRFVVASGPYMIKGSDAADASSCDTLEPYAGLDPSSHLHLVRNPNYDQATDDLRKNYVDGIQITVNSNVDDIFNKVRSGELDASYVDQPPRPLLQQYATDPALRDKLHINDGDRTWYLFLNTTQAPFDDINVRKAVNLVLDKASVLQAWGGESAGKVATHIAPPSLVGNMGEEYNPYATPNHAGDEAAAKEAMKLSQYDTNKDGTCDHPSCQDIVFINRNVEPWSTSEPIVVRDFAKLGIELIPRAMPSGPAYETTQTVSNNMKAGLNAGWGKDYGDAVTFFDKLFTSGSILATGNTNLALVGITQEQVGEFDVELAGSLPPSIDADVATCQAIPSTDANRVTCWANLDKKVMETVVPWVPYLWSTVRTTTGDTVTAWDFDQFSGVTALTQVAVNNNATL